MTDSLYFGEAPGPLAQRRMRTGHILRWPQLIAGFDNLWVIRCEGDDCGWFSAPFDKNDPAQKTDAEKRAFAHRTEPTLLVAGSSDILRGMRMATLQDLVAKSRRQR